MNALQLYDSTPKSHCDEQLYIHEDSWIRNPRLCPSLFPTGHTLRSHFQDLHNYNKRCAICQFCCSEYRTAEALGALRRVHWLNGQQRQVLKKVVEGVRMSKNGQIFRIAGRSGTGKTGLLRAIGSQLSAEGRSVLSIGSTEQASSLLDRGFSANRIFPISAEGEVKIDPKFAGRLLHTDVIIWDEIAYTSKAHIEGADEALRQLRGMDSLFGGISLVMGGEVLRWKQCGGMTACSSYLWNSVVAKYSFSLIDSVRLHTEHSIIEQGFDHLLHVRASLHGRFLDSLPRFIPRFAEARDLCQYVFSQQLLDNLEDPDMLLSRAVITSNEKQRMALNDLVFKRLPGELMRYEASYPDGSEPVGMPEAYTTLHLKVGMPVILLATLSEEEGLYQGTRLVIERLNEHSIRAHIVGGDFNGCAHTIPAITSTTMYGSFRQIPVLPCFAITVGEARGLTFDVVGVCVEGMSDNDVYNAVSKAASVNHIGLY